MDRLDNLRIFIRVVETGSFSKAAADLSMGQPIVSKRVSALEEMLDVRLLRRSTRSLSLTEEGQRVYRDAAILLSSFEGLMKPSSPSAPNGIVRVACPVALGSLHVMPLMKDFSSLFPDVRVEFKMSDAFVDLVEEGIDVALRVGKLSDSSQTAKFIGSMERIVVASRSYLKDHSAPHSPKDLERHRCIIYDRFSPNDRWAFKSNHSLIKVKVRGNLKVDSPVSVRAAVLAGLGVGMGGALVFYENGALHPSLQRILKNYRLEPLPLHILFHPKRKPTSSVRAFIEFFHSRLKKAPWIHAI